MQSMLPRGASHYVFEPEFCNPAAGWEKGQIEKNVRDARSRMWQIMPVFKDLDALNQWLEDRHAKGVLSARRIALWAETKHRELPGSITDVWEAEKPLLMALPPAFDGFVEHSKRVSPTCLITFERNRYSVPASFANRRVSLHVYPERLVIVAEGLIVCTHDRIIDRSHRKSGRVIYVWRHYLAVIQRKPEALRPSRQICCANRLPGNEWRAVHKNARGFPPSAKPHATQGRGWPRPSRDIAAQYPVRQWMVDILSLVLHHDEGTVLQAVELALEAGVPNWRLAYQPRRTF
jgi:hypothetical protein